MHKSLRRILLILDYLERRKKSSFKDIKQYLYSHDMHYSTRTFQRDLDELRNDYGIEITYFRAENYYFIDKDQSLDYASILRLFRLMGTGQLLLFSALGHPKF